MTSSATADPERRDQRGDPSPERVPTSEAGPRITGEVPEELLAPVLKDAAALAGIGAEDVAILTAQQMLWSDGSLGCAEPGQVYTQAQVLGYWVVVEASGVAFDYRLTDAGTFRRCENPLPVPPGSGAPQS